MKYTCINIQGNFISEEVLQNVETASADFQKATDFGFEPGTNLRDEIEYSWSRIKLDWKHFSEKAESLPASDQYGTTLSRKWMENFFSSIGFDIVKQKEALKGENNLTYTISHVAVNNNGLPAQIVGFYDPFHPEKNTLDIKSSGGTSRLSPHGTVQEYLNVTEHIYGFATNGTLLRLIRDSGRLVKLTYVEFDLKRMLDEDKYSEFTILYRLIHSSRFNNEASIIEKYYQESIETGNRIRDGLSEAVKESMQALGNGFIQHPSNEALREKLKNKTITPKQYYDQLRRLVYRLLFLMVTEERDLIYDQNELKGDLINKKQIYLRYYSIARLRNLSENRYLYEKEFTDLWQGLLNTFFLFEAGGNGNKIGIKPLDGDLFSETALKDINGAEIGNHVLLECIRNLNEFQDKETKMLVSINYRSLDVEELGSVYEGLLELHPIIEHLDATNPANTHFTFHSGTERKTTGSYYTRPDLVNELIKSALIPVIEERIKEAGTEKGAQLNALLKLKVCDTAAGSGHMILAAARTIAWYMARIDSGEENPAPSIYRHWLRQAIQHCIYAVDMNPDAVELCKLALWLEGHNSGKPLSFLDHKIRCGNSLIGVTDLKILLEPLPDNAFDPVTGDDKTVCQILKKQNKKYRETRQTNLFSAAESQIQNDKIELAREYGLIGNISQDSVEEIGEIKKHFGKVRKSVYHEEKACDIWTSAFFQTYCKPDDPSNPTSEKLDQYFLAPTQYGQLIGEATRLSIENKFFHWPLEFPDVFDQGGFDVILGNPPWEKIQVEEIPFFSLRDPEISLLKGSERKKRIQELKINNPTLHAEFYRHRKGIESFDKFIKSGKRFPLTGAGKMNTYASFSELASHIVKDNGRVGLVLPLGVVTDDNNKTFFNELIISNRIGSIVGFENESFIFKAVHHSFKFILLTIGGKATQFDKSTYCFFCRQPQDSKDANRVYSLSTSDILKLNPNTRTSPIFRTSIDANINLKIYKNFPVIQEDLTEKNPWKLGIHRMINPTDDSRHFKNLNHLISQGGEKIGNLIAIADEIYYPVYESKMIHQYSHRFGTYTGQTVAQRNQGKLPEFSDQQLEDPTLPIEFVNYISSDILDSFTLRKTDRLWFFGFRDVTSAVVTNTAIGCVIPKSGAVDPCRVIYFSNEIKAYQFTCFIGMFNSMVFDYLCRQKVSGNHLAIFILKQLPIIPPEKFNRSLTVRISCIVLELTYTSWDIKAFADDIWNEADDEMRLIIKKQWEENETITGGHEFSPPNWYQIKKDVCPLAPFKWNEKRRSILKAELDAIYAMLYGLTEQELCYIIDPQDIYGEDFPSETFRVLKDKEIKKFGEYRTKRLVLEAWERMSENTNPIVKVPLKLTNVDTMKEFNLHEGIYSIKDTAEITGLSKEKIKRWFKELSNEQYEGLDYQQQTDVDKMRISFHGLIEVVVIGTLRENNFSLKKILKARADLYEKTHKIYPFATNNVKDHLKVSGRDIVFEFDDDTKVTLDGTSQINIGFITQFFRDIVFDVDGVAQKLIPSKGKGKVVIDPKEGGGKPSIVGKEIWVDLINNIYTGPDSITMIKDQYNLEEDEILAAVEFSK